MPVVQPAYPYKDVCGIIVGDIHLSEKPPTARMAEPDWKAAMLRPINEVKELAEHYNVPVLCNGDVFHTPAPGPRFINWAIENIFDAAAIPGNHDLPDHRYEAKKESAYWTLCEARKLTDMPAGECTAFPAFGAVAFPYGTPLAPCKEEWHEFYFYISIAHKYIWTGRSGFPGAPKENEACQLRKQLSGYTAAFFGDNHQGFDYPGPPTICNVGCMLRRRRDEFDYKPACAILHNSGAVTRHYFDCSKDKFFSVASFESALKNDGSLAAVCQELAGLGAVSCDFKEMVKRRVAQSDVRKSVRILVLDALEATQ